MDEKQTGQGTHCDRLKMPGIRTDEQQGVPNVISNKTGLIHIKILQKSLEISPALCFMR